VKGRPRDPAGEYGVIQDSVILEIPAERDRRLQNAVMSRGVHLGFGRNT
jgi:hypothetical protein